MFNQCLKLKEIKGIENFNTKNVIKMNSIFQECKELEYLDLSNFSSCNTEEMSYMFNHCHKLKEIHGLSNFDKKKLKQ